jgi:hypothetical protein
MIIFLHFTSWEVALGEHVLEFYFIIFLGVNFFDLGRVKKCERYKGFLYLKWAQKQILMRFCQKVTLFSNW